LKFAVEVVGIRLISDWKIEVELDVKLDVKLQTGL